jgi:hypothetical protein
VLEARAGGLEQRASRLELGPRGRSHHAQYTRERASSRSAPTWPRAPPPRAPHPSALRLAPPPSTLISPAGPPRWPMSGRDSRCTRAGRGSGVHRVAHTRARACARRCARASSALRASRREAERAQARRRCSVVGMPAALAFQARTRGHPACVRGLPLLPVRVTAGAPRRAAALFLGYRVRARTCAPLGGL